MSEHCSKKISRVTTNGVSRTSPHQVRRLLADIPRRHFANLPTPFEALPGLSKELGINVFVKRDDLTGLAMGGNKVRKLEFVIADALAQNADCILTWAGVQSNWCCQLAAAARQVGLHPILVLFKRPKRPSGYDGNLLLDLIYGAEVHLFDLDYRQMMEYENVRDIIDDVAIRASKAGHRVYITPTGASLAECSMTRPLGAFAYVDATAEIFEQAERASVRVDSIVLATGSGGTQAGLMVGAKLLSPHTRIIGIAVSEDRPTMEGYVMKTALQTWHDLFPLSQATEISRNELIVLDDYVGEGYGIFDANSAAALSATARLDGLLLDPVYTSRAVAAIMHLAKSKFFQPEENVVLLHTGGLPSLFAYREALVDCFLTRSDQNGGSNT